MAADFNDPAWLRRERRLIRRARRGDREAFGQLYRAFAPALYRQVLLPRLADEAAAEDALAETFVTAWHRLDQFEQRGPSVFFWLARVAANKAIDVHRSRGRSDRAMDNLQRALAPLVAPAQGEEDEVLRRVDAAALRSRVSEVLARIHDRYRRAIELRFLEGLDRAACAERLQVKLGTFDVVLLRALKAFRKEWSDE